MVMVISAASIPGNLEPAGGIFQFRFCIGPDSLPVLAAAAALPYLVAQRWSRCAVGLSQPVASGASPHIPIFRSKAISMKKYLTSQSIAMLARIAVLCVLAAVLSAGFSPAFAAVLSRGADIRAMLPAVFSMIRTIRDRLSPFGASARFSMGQIISLV
jgi:hypothetical protein